MAKKSIKMRAKAKNGVVTVKCLMTHAMETGTRKDKKTGKLIPAHYINEVVCKHNGNVVSTAYWSGSVSKNPYMALKFDGAKGDAITVSWKDNQGGSDTADTKVR